MRCPKCDKKNPASRAFCIFCGSPIGGNARQEQEQPREERAVASPDHEGGAALQEQVRSLEKEVYQIRQALLRIENRLSALEGLQPSPSAGQRAPVEAPLPVESAAVEALPVTELSPVGIPPTIEPAPVEALPAKELVGVEALSTIEPARVEATLISEPARVEAMPTVPPPAPPVSKRRPALDWEQAVPGNWLARIGVLALIIGIGFFLKLAFDNDWIGETGRVILGIVGGVILLGAGEHWQKRYPAWAQALTGGGIAILYLSVFAGFALYNLMTFLPTFGLMFLITAAAVGLALRYESKAIAILGIIGAFATPIILDVAGPPATGGGQGSSSALVLAYVLLLDVGVLGVATFRNWRWFTLLGLVCSLLLFGLWYSRSADQADLWVAEAALTGIFLIFAGATSLFHILWRQVPEPADLALMVLNAAAYFGISYGLMWDDFKFLLGGFSLLLALFYGLLGYAALVKGRENARLCFFAVGIALVFLTIAVPVQLGGAWIAVAWAVEGAVLMWLSFVLGIFQFRRFSLGVFAIVVIRLVFFDLSVERLTFLPIFNERFVAFMAGISAMYLAAHFLWRGRTLIRREERWLFPVFLVAANFFSLLILSAEAISYFGSRNTMILSLTLIWAVYALVLIGVGMVKRWRWVRLGGLALLCVPVAKAFVSDMPALEEGYRMAVFMADISGLYLAACLLRRSRTLISKEEWQFFTPFVVAANFMSLWMLSDAAISYFDTTNAKSLALTLLWAVYALVLIVLGITRRWRWVRLGGLALLCIPIAKVFVYDVFTLEQGYRVAAFLALGAILIAGGFLYQRYSKVIRRFLLE